MHRFCCLCWSVRMWTSADICIWCICVRYESLFTFYVCEKLFNLLQANVVCAIAITYKVSLCECYCVWLHFIVWQAYENNFQSHHIASHAINILFANVYFSFEIHFGLFPFCVWAIIAVYLDLECNATHGRNGKVNTEHNKREVRFETDDYFRVGFFVSSSMILFILFVYDCFQLNYT